MSEFRGFDFDMDDVSEKKPKSKKEKSPEQLEEEAEYKRWLKRVELVKWSNTSYSKMIIFLENNKSYFINEKYDQRAREEMRRVCQKAYDRNIWASSEGDTALFNELFGAYKVSIPTLENTQGPIGYDDGSEYNPKQMPFGKQVAWYSDSSYQHWWDYVHSKEFISAWTNRGMDVDRFIELKNQAVLNNRTFFKGDRQYSVEDEEYYNELKRMIL